jgi:hypothetical protein
MARNSQREILGRALTDAICSLVAYDSSARVRARPQHGMRLITLIDYDQF